MHGRLRFSVAEGKVKKVTVDTLATVSTNGIQEQLLHPGDTAPTPRNWTCFRSAIKKENRETNSLTFNHPLLGHSVFYRRRTGPSFLERHKGRRGTLEIDFIGTVYSI